MGRKVAILLLLIITLMALRALTGGYLSMRSAQSFAQRGDTDKALLHYDATIRWHVPGSPWTKRAVADLASLAQTFEGDNNGARALQVSQILTAALHGIRWLRQPYAMQLEVEKSRQLELLGERLQMERAQLGALNWHQQRGPNDLWSTIGPLAFLGWIGAVILFLFQVLSADGRVANGRRAWQISSIGLLSFGLWCGAGYLS